MTVGVIYYDTEGKICKVCGIMPETIELNRPEGTLHLLADNVDMAASYVRDGVITERPTMALSAVPATLAVDTELVVTGLPSHSIVHHIGGIDAVDDGSLEWESDLPGIFMFRVLAFPYQEEFFRVQVTT